MAYSYHTKVKDIITLTNELIDQHKDVVNVDSDKMLLLPEGFYVSPQVAELCAKVRSYQPSCKFGYPTGGSKVHWVDQPPVDNGGQYMDRRRAKVMMNVSVYYPTDYYVMGDIGYANISRNSSADPKYFVMSRVIKNEKYRVSSDGYHAKISEKIDVVVRAANQNLRPYRLQEIARMTEISYEVRKASTEVSNACEKAKSNVVYSNLLMAEVKGLLDQGHQFIDPKFKDLCTAWMQADQAQKEEAARAVPVVFVMVHNVRDKQTFDVLQVDDAKKVKGYTDENYKAMPSQRYTEDDLPEEYMSKLAVLSILEIDTYSKGVGKRVDENVFWLEV